MFGKKKAEEVAQSLQRFKMHLLRRAPFYGDILLRVRIREDGSIRTAATDGREIRYNPSFFASLNEKQRGYVLLHELLHMLLMHWKRRSSRDAQLWNVACDLVVNTIADRLQNRWNGLEIERPPQGCFVDSSYVERSAEEYYRQLVKDNPDAGKVKYYLLDLGELRGYGFKNIKKQPKLDQDLICTEEKDTEGSDAEMRIRELLCGAAKYARSAAGSYYIPGQMLMMTASKRLPWNVLLQEYLQETVEEEASYLTPERKYIHMDLIIPGIGTKDEILTDIWAFVDTSGSIDEDSLNQFLTQLYRISKEFHAIMHIAYWDTRVTDVYRNIRRKEEILRCRPTHTGGTDVNCVYAYLREEKIDPGVLLILTDGYFGRAEAVKASLRKKTILVIAEDGAQGAEIEALGRIARL
ncbi:MAG: hypothetical protein IJ600_01780 [Lachnospiraceae bacterium]|nr:hypothetical protein [Lachnospiraceae bacterium]